MIIIIAGIAAAVFIAVYLYFLLNKAVEEPKIKNSKEDVKKSD